MLTCGRLRSPPFQSPAQRDQTRPGDRRRCRLGRVHITEGLLHAVEIGRYLHPVVRAHGKRRAEGGVCRTGGHRATREVVVGARARIPGI